MSDILHLAEEDNRLNYHPHTIIQRTNRGYLGIFHQKYYQAREFQIWNERQSQTNFQRHSDTENIHTQYVYSAHLLPMKNDYLKILQKFQVNKDNSILGSSGRFTAWDSKT